MRRAAWFCGAISLAVFVSFYLLPEGVLLPAAGLCALLSALAAALLRGKNRVRAHLALLGAAIGLCAFFVQEHFIAAPSDALAGEKRTISARVTDYPDIYDTSEYVTVRITDAELPNVLCRVASYDTANFSALTPGDELRIPVKLLSARERNGQSVDTYAARGIFLRATATGEPERTGRWSFSFLYAPKALCRAVGSLCKTVFPADVQPFLTALLTGDKTDLYADGAHYYALADAGLAHVVAVSGMHIAFLMGVLFLLVGRSPRSAALCLPVLLLFAAMTGFTPSVTRAAVMQMFLLSAPLFHRENDGITSLCTALALLLLWNPSACASVGLQLSFSSVAGIWLISGRMYRALCRRIDALNVSRRVFRRLLFLAAGSVSSSVGAMALSAPLTAVHFGSVSVVSPVSNILCLWIVSAIYIGGYFAVALGAVLPGAAALAGRVLAWGVRYIYAVSGALASLPCANVYVRNPVFAVWLALVYALFLAAWLRSRKTGRFRALAPAGLSLLALFAAALFVRAGWRDELRLAALDVGQGECIVVTAGDRAAVIDCGGSYVTHDAGRSAVQFLGGECRKRIDALILTHLHADHGNGAAQLLQRVRVDTLYLPQEMNGGSLLEEILAAAEQRGTRIEYVTENMELSLGTAALTVWAPLLPVSEDENENGLVIEAAQGDFEAFILGDAPAKAERALIASAPMPDAEVLFVAHHGSNTSTCKELLEAITPETAVISVGYNTYGHPTQRVLDRLADYNIAVLRTDTDGTVTVAAREE